MAKHVRTGGMVGMCSSITGCPHKMGPIIVFWLAFPTPGSMSQDVEPTRSPDLTPNPTCPPHLGGGLAPKPGSACAPDIESRLKVTGSPVPSPRYPDFYPVRDEAAGFQTCEPLQTPPAPSGWGTLVSHVLLWLTWLATWWGSRISLEREAPRGLRGSTSHPPSGAVRVTETRERLGRGEWRSERAHRNY